MKIAVISDIHGNYDALEAVLEDIDKQERIDKIYCLGDIVGYGAQPNECIETIRKLDCVAVAGNHDFASVEKYSSGFFKSFAKKTIMWTKKVLTEDNRKWLQGVDYLKRMNGTSFVHGTPFSPKMFYYISSLDDAKVSFEEMQTDLCFVGHSHIPVVFFATTPISYVHKDEVRIIPKEKTIVNVGSVGQPRDEDPRACYAIYDHEESIVALKRIPYDINTACDKILKAGLPEICGTRLHEGR